MSFKFTKILKEILVENAKMEFQYDKYTKPKVDKDGNKTKPLLTKDEFITLIQADPETKMNNVDPETASEKELMEIKPGAYSEWIIKYYLNPELNDEEKRMSKDSPEYPKLIKRKKEMFIGEDLDKITADLKKFVRFKNRIEGERNIQKLTPSELYDKVKDFSLEKKKASKGEIAVAAETFEHPGADVIFRGENWTVVRISDKGELGRNAACFYGGYYLRPETGETNWCTSSPGLRWFDNYISKGPLYVVIPNQYQGKRGEKSGLPSERYQFHFPDNMFMDVHDRSVDLVELLNGKMSELKNVFKPEFAKGLIGNTQTLDINDLTSGKIGKFISLYGLEDLFESLPEDLEKIHIVNQRNFINVEIPPSIGRFKNLETLSLNNCISSLPNEVCELKSLNFMSLVNNQNLKSIPDCIGELPNLIVVNLKNSPNVEIPESFRKRAIDRGYNIWDFELE